MKNLLVQLFMLYKKYISAGLGARCRYSPSCSAYAVQAVLEHGWVKGILLALWRLARCNPFSKGGYDPVPYKLKGEIKWVL